MLTAAITNILEHDNRGDRPTEVLLMAIWGQQEVLDRPSLRVMRWRKGALYEDVVTTRTYQPG